MERLLFESKGAPTKAVVVSGVGGGILAVLGIVIIVISQMKHATHSVYSGVYGGAMSYSGSYGGGYLVGEGARTMLIVFLVSILPLHFSFSTISHILFFPVPSYKHEYGNNIFSSFLIS